MSGNESPEEQRDYQLQWNATKAMYQAEINILRQDLNNKINEYQTMKSNMAEWTNTPIQERIELRHQIILAQSEVAMVEQELTNEFNTFLGVNPAARQTVKF